MEEEQDSDVIENYKTTQYDIDRMLDDFLDWMEEPVKDETRVDRLVKNSVHIFMSLVTMGAYIFVYLGYLLYRFTNSRDMDKYRVEIEHTVRDEKKSE